MSLDAGRLLPYAAALAALAVALALLRRGSRSKKPKVLAPTPPGWVHIPLFDRLTNPNRDGLTISQAFTAIGKMIGGYMYRLNLVALEINCCSDPELVKELIVTNNPPKGHVYQLFAPLLGEGSIVTAHGELWQRSRRAFNAAFSWASLKQKLPLIYLQARRSTAVLQGVASTGSVVKMLDHVTVLTQQVIVHSMLGKELDLLATDGKHPLFDAFHRLADYVFWVARNSHLMGLLAYTPLGLCLTWRDQACVRSALRPWVAECVRLAELDPTTTPVEAQGLLPGGTPRILVSALRAAKEQGQPMSLEFCVRQILGLIFAGHDTTASTTAWTLLEASRHPHVEDRLLAELREAMGDAWLLGLEERAPTADELGQLKYMNVVLKEVLRLYPPLGVPSRHAPPGMQLGGYDVGGSSVVFNIYAMQRDPAIWGEDAAEFRPERWLDEKSMSKVHPVAWSPFSRGARDCIGQQFALLEMRVLLAELLRHFRFTYAGDKPEEVASTLLDKPKWGVPMRVHLRTWEK